MGSLLEAIVAVIKKISARGINVEQDKPAGLVICVCWASLVARSVKNLPAV